jgi:hypothetical protein
MPLKKTLTGVPSYRAAVLTRADFNMVKANAGGTIVVAIRMNPSSAFDNGP